MFLTLLLAVLADDDCRAYTVYLPDNCNSGNTITLSKKDQQAFKIPISFNGTIVQPSNTQSYVNLYDSGVSDGSNDYVCVAMWGAGFLKYDSDLQFRTDAWADFRSESCNLDAKNKNPVQSKDNAFILNMDDDSVGLVRFHRTGGQGTLYLYNSAELEIEGDAYVSNEEYANGTLSSSRDDEATLAFFANGKFSLSAYSRSGIEMEPYVMNCDNSEINNGKCEIKELNEKKGQTISLNDQSGEFVYVKFEGEGNSIKCDFSFSRVASSRQVASSSDWSQSISKKISIGSSDYIYAYGDVNKSTIVAIAVGTVVGVVVVAVAVGVGVWFWRKSKRTTP